MKITGKVKAAEKKPECWPHDTFVKITAKVNGPREIVFPVPVHQAAAYPIGRWVQITVEPLRSK